MLILFLVSILMTGCRKEVTSLTGTVKVTFTNQPADLRVVICSVENPDIALTDQLIPDINKTVQYDLKVGNYVLKGVSTTFFPNVGFQIKAGETTKIYYDAKNLGHVQQKIHETP